MVNCFGRYLLITTLVTTTNGYTFLGRSTMWSSTITKHTSTARHMATWSDSKAVRDYQDFLNSGQQGIQLSQDRPSVIIQSPRRPSPLGQALLKLGNGHDLLLTPDQDLPQCFPGDGDTEYPIYITIPPFELNDFLMNLKDSYKARPEDFVFFSGGLEYGNIEDVLKDRGYCRDSMTQVLISGIQINSYGVVQDMSVALPLAESGEEKWAGECAACGKWAGSITERLQRSNIRCRTDFYREWRRRMWERSAYDAIFHLIGAVRDQPTTCAQVALYYGEEASDMLWEMSQLLRGWRAVTLTYGFEERVFGIGESAGKEILCQLIDEMYPFLWGNQVFLQSKMYCEYLIYAQSEMGLLQGVVLPQKRDEDFATKMRQGNLRADGVV